MHVEPLEQSPDPGVHPGDHRRGALLGFRPVPIRVHAEVGNLHPFPARLVVRMGDGERKVEEERLVVMRIDPGQRLLHEQVMRIGVLLRRMSGAARVGIGNHVVEWDPLTVPNQKLRIVVVGVPLIGIAEVAVEPLEGRLTASPGIAQPPFSDQGGCIPLFREDLGERHLLGRQGNPSVATHEGVPGVLSGHEHAA
jgi:hypothetical protein